jgi:hypothetical protein
MNDLETKIDWEQIVKTVDASTPNNWRVHEPDRSEWVCYLFGNRPGRQGMTYYPKKGYEPNWFVRWMMRICFDCLWVKEK